MVFIVLTNQNTELHEIVQICLPTCYCYRYLVTCKKNDYPGDQIRLKR